MPDGYKGAYAGLFWLNDAEDKIYIDEESLVDITEENIERSDWVIPKYGHASVDTYSLRHKRGRVEFGGNTLTIGLLPDCPKETIEMIKKAFGAQYLENRPGIVVEHFEHNHWSGSDEWEEVEYKVYTEPVR